MVVAPCKQAQHIPSVILLLACEPTLHELAYSSYTWLLTLVVWCPVKHASRRTSLDATDGVFMQLSACCIWLRQLQHLCGGVGNKRQRIQPRVCRQVPVSVPCQSSSRTDPSGHVHVDFGRAAAAAGHHGFYWWPTHARQHTVTCSADFRCRSSECRQLSSGGADCAAGPSGEAHGWQAVRLVQVRHRVRDLVQLCVKGLTLLEDSSDHRLELLIRFMSAFDACACQRGNACVTLSCTSSCCHTLRLSLSKLLQADQTAWQARGRPRRGCFCKACQSR